jgi:hypothetical protein
MGEQKRVVIGGKPSRRTDADAGAAEAWMAKAQAAQAAAGPAAMKRFTIAVPEDLHTRIKVQCAQKGVKMADVIRALLAERFPETPCD